MSNETAAHLPERHEISPEHTWSLDDIYPDETAWQTDFGELKRRLPALSAYAGTLASSASQLYGCLSARDELSIIGGKLYAFARMHRDENTALSQYQGLTAKTEALLAEADGCTSFIEPEILSIPAEMLQEFRQQQPELVKYSFFFDNLLRQQQHILSPAEEALLSRMSEVAQAPENAFNMLAHADMEFPLTTDEHGQQVQLSEGRYSSLIRSSQRTVRQEAFTKLFGTYHQYRNTFAATLTGNVKKNIFYATARRYPSALAAALEADNVPLEVYSSLIDTVCRNLEPLHRYVELKKRVFHLEAVHMYDLYAPLVAEADISLPYAQGCSLVKQGLAPLGSTYAAQLETAMNSRWIDVYESKNKQTGAYAWGTYGTHPFILLNYHGRYDDVSTLAHELGHAMHSYYSHQRQPYPTASYTTFCAEVASTTNEILLLEHMLQVSTDDNLKMHLINQYLEQVRGTVYRQTMFAEFEKTIHETVEKGGALTADMLEELWLKLNQKYYGSSIIIDEEIAIEWARIPHFYMDFYVYQYVTGYAAATALAQQLLSHPQEAQERYLDFLHSGGSDYSIALLKKAGVDMSEPRPIEVTLNKFSTMLNTLEDLLSKAGKL